MKARKVKRKQNTKKSKIKQKIAISPRYNFSHYDYSPVAIS